MLLNLPPDIIDQIFYHITIDAMDQSRNYINIEQSGNTKRLYEYNGTMLNGLPHGQGTMCSCVKYNQPTYSHEKSIWFLCNLIFVLKSYVPIIK